MPYNDVELISGMVISNEPGYYADGKFGIRIENIDVIKMSATPMNFGGKEFMELEHVTMVRGGDSDGGTRQLMVGSYPDEVGGYLLVGTGRAGVVERVPR